MNLRNHEESNFHFTNNGKNFFRLVKKKEEF